MRRKILLAAALAAIASFAFAPKPAQARGDLVTVRDSYMPGTIVIHTSERALYYFVGPGQALRYPVGVGRLRHPPRRARFFLLRRPRPGAPLSCRCRPPRHAMVGHRVHRRQIYQAG